MVIDRIFFQCSFHFIGQVIALLSKCRLVINHIKNLCSFTQTGNCHEVRRDEKLEDCGIIRRSESRHNQSTWLHRCPITTPAYSVISAVCHTKEMIRSHAFFALLLMKSEQSVFNCLQPSLSKDRSITRNFPIFIGQSNGITFTVYLIFTLMNFWFHSRVVALPFTSRWTIIESIGISIDICILKLPENNAPKHFLQLRIFINQTHIRPHLSSRIALPHGGNITGIDKRIVVSVLHPIMNGRFKCIRITVLKHPSKSWIALQYSFNTLNFFLYCFRLEKPFGHRRTLTHKSCGITCNLIGITL